jgi:hypothetical protein
MNEENPRCGTRHGKPVEVETPNLDGIAPPGGLLDRFKTKPRVVGDPAAVKPRQQKREIVMVTHAQFDRLSQAECAAADRVFLHLLFLTWRPRDRGKPVILANAELARKGIDRFAKRRALLELEALGLIKVEWRDKKSPIVTVLEG